MGRNKDLLVESDEEEEVVGSKLSLSTSEERRLLALIKMEKSLWKFDDPCYKKAKNVDRKKTWAGLDEMFNKNDGVCESFFRTARLERRRTLKQVERTKSGSAAVPLKKLKYDEEMAFLDKLLEEETLSSVSKSKPIELDEDDDVTPLPAVKKERSDGTKAFLKLAGVKAEGSGSVTVEKRRRGGGTLKKVVEEESKTDQMIERLMESMVNEKASPSTTVARSSYVDIHDRIDSLLDSLPSSVRYRAIGEIHQLLNTVEDKFTSRNPMFPSNQMFQNPNFAPPQFQYHQFPTNSTSPPITAPPSVDNSNAMSQVAQIWRT